MNGYQFILMFCTIAVLDAGTPEHVWLRALDSYNNKPKLDVNLSEELHIQFYREGKWTYLHLKENPHIRTDTDMYVIQSLSDSSKNAVKATLIEKTGSKYYNDLKHKSYFTARCIKTVERRCAIALEGILRMEDKDLQITPVSDSEYLDRLYVYPDFSDTLHFIEEHRASGARNNSSDEDVDRNYNNKIAPDDAEENDIKESIFVKLLKSLDSLYASAKNTSASTVYGVEVLVVVDPPIWTRFHSLAKGNTQNAMKCVREYITQVLNQVDLRYKTITGRSFSVYVSLKAIVVIKIESGAPFMRVKPFPNNGVSYINESYLGGFIKWLLNSSGMPWKSDLDHHMMSTGYTSNGRSLGITYLKDVCTGTRFSILDGYFMRMLLAIHEMSYNPGSGHDRNIAAGDCDLGFIIHAITNYNHKPWDLSMCPIDSFENDFSTKSAVGKESNFNDKQKNNYYNGLYRGQMYGPEKECKAVFGEHSNKCISCIDGRCVSRPSDVINPNTTTVTPVTTTKITNLSSSCRDEFASICKAGYKISNDQVKFCSAMGKYCCATCKEKSKCTDTGYYNLTCGRIRTFYSSQTQFCSKWSSNCCASCSSTVISRQIQVRLAKRYGPR
ncbi:hypothetical protein CHS0354_024789 [Potamilus streckersoni]|uniref:Peptidase M12B domain-containing protein n=1 Tax=Potamilus streckersoni TaxID=2493646 RepID=A0AAE0T0D6_9BIVA|nr:hypothetical protein CHS0354_024789 [Potamilus streckersoni]